MVYPDIRTAIRSVRKELRVSQAELAEKTGTCQSQVSLFESGKGNPTIATLEKWMEALGIYPASI